MWKDKRCDARLEPEMLSVVEAFARYTKIDLEAVLEDQPAFLAEAARLGLNLQPDASWSDIFSAILATHIEPKLGIGRLTFLHRYPICEAALARPCEDDPRFALRFEMYACGVELANGFDELTDPVEQRRRFEADQALQERLYGVKHPIDEDFLAALEHMPQACGVALGFDRLVMLATGARHISDVQWTPWPITETEA